MKIEFSIRAPQWCFFLASIGDPDSRLQHFCGCFFGTSERCRYLFYRQWSAFQPLYCIRIGLISHVGKQPSLATFFSFLTFYSLTICIIFLSNIRTNRAFSSLLFSSFRKEKERFLSQINLQVSSLNIFNDPDLQFHFF